MAKVLSTKSRLRTGLYKTSTSMFFTPSKLFEAQMTEIFDEVWPTVTALKMLRWQVKGYYEEYCIKDNSRLSQKFVEIEDVTNRPNLYRICLENSWEDTEYKIAKNLLTNIFACYEGWVENILRLLNVPDFKNYVMCFQNPTSKANNYQTLLNQLSVGGNVDLIDAFYDVYKRMSKHHDYSKLNNWLLFYRYFKECRNAIIHNGGQTTKRVTDAYSQISSLTATDLNVLEVPQFYATLINEPIRLSLRGVVGFSQITIKIVSTLDVELIKAKNADEYFVNRILEEVKGCQTISSEKVKRQKSVCSLASKGCFQKPEKIDSAYKVMKAGHVVF